MSPGRGAPHGGAPHGRFKSAAESFFQGLKRELLHGRRWTSKALARLELFRWMSCADSEQWGYVAYKTV